MTGGEASRICISSDPDPLLGISLAICSLRGSVGVLFARCRSISYLFSNAAISSSFFALSRNHMVSKDGGDPGYDN